MQLLAHQSTETLLDFRVCRDLLRFGANSHCLAQRERLQYSIECLADVVPNTFEVLAQMIRFPLFDEHEMHDALANYAFQYDRDIESGRSIGCRLADALHAAAFHNNTLGMPLRVLPKVLEQIDSNILSHYHKALFTPNRIVVVGHGVEHQQMVDLAKRHFGDMTTNHDVSLGNAKYVGGETRLHDALHPDGMTHIGVAFPSPKWTSPDVYAASVLNSIMGEGKSFSTCGPGSGVHSRMMKNVVDERSYIGDACSFHAPHEDAGLFGLIGSVSTPKASPKLLELLLKEASNMAVPPTSEELSRAKNLLISRIYQAKETGIASVDNLSCQLLIQNKVNSVSDSVAKINAVTADDIARVAKTMISAPISFAGIGDLSFIPRYDRMKKLL